MLFFFIMHIFWLSRRRVTQNPVSSSAKLPHVHPQEPRSQKTALDTCDLIRHEQNLMPWHKQRQISLTVRGAMFPASSFPAPSQLALRSTRVLVREKESINLTASQTRLLLCPGGVLGTPSPRNCSVLKAFSPESKKILLSQTLKAPRIVHTHRQTFLVHTC